MGRWGVQHGRGSGQVKFYPYKKGGQNVLAMLSVCVGAGGGGGGGGEGH